MNNFDSIVCSSGGQDSTTALLCELQAGRSVLALLFDYGQRHGVERSYARMIVDHLVEHDLPVERRTIGVSSLAHLGGNALTDHGKLITGGDGAHELPSTFVPGRNIIFATIAAALAYQVGASRVVLGVSQQDFSGYPDCRASTIDSLRATLILGLERSFELATPLIDKTKAQTWELLEDVDIIEDAVEFVRTMTHTCYAGSMKWNDYGQGCDQCPACALRRDGWEEFKDSRGS